MLSFAPYIRSTSSGPGIRFHPKLSSGGFHCGCQQHKSTTQARGSGWPPQAGPARGRPHLLRQHLRRRRVAVRFPESEETFPWAETCPWGRGVTALVHGPPIPPLEKLSWRRVGRGAPTGVLQAARPARVLSTNSHGYREIFIPRRWAPAATAAGRAATTREPSHPRDKDSSVT